MSTAKERMHEIIHRQPDDASYEEILRELAFERMIAAGLDDVRKGRTQSNEAVKERMAKWRR